MIDTHIVSPHNFDFFLVSHHALKGTARALKYWVVCDDIGWGADEIQKLTFHLCHMYQRCSSIVSCPSPVFYAHLAAYRARFYASDFGDEDGWSDTASMRSGSTSGTDVAKGLAESLKSKLFFL